MFADLEPYICTFPKCDLGLKSFANRKAWANHEFIVHRSKRTWVCSHCKRTFDDPNLFGWHLSKDHSGILPDDGIESVVKSVATTSVAVEDTACPFCRENLGNSNRTFAMHVARHMEEIALAVLPRDYDSDNEHGSVESDQSLPAMLHEDQIPDGDPEASQAIANPLRKPWNLENFDFLALLGRANYAKVALVRSKETQRLYAAKIFKKSFLLENDDMNSPLVEKQVLKLANENSHPFIARLCASTQTLTRVVFFMEYCPGGDLLVHIQRASQAFPVDTARYVDRNSRLPTSF